MDGFSDKEKDPMTDCGDQSHYKAFFIFDTNNNYCAFYYYVGPNGKHDGFENKILENCDQIADLCNVKYNYTAGKYSLKLGKATKISKI